ncbi:class I adenylate-forming enzyme family protein [uncultured Hyphomonas sp.]|uniref:class I adenylate-forming enzyme family protein n=1 Tax=uncultured Hyphomonas sp. TaxID=225298 RepID=UPI002AAC1815|nr:class I adenylate-forming enzyme family protein [uncultured Hyphomonas sp.]
MPLSAPEGFDLPPAFPRISDFVGHYAAQTPDTPAMVLEGQHVSYRQFHDKVEALARALLSAGVRKGDRVATLCTPSPDYFVCFLATASIGGIWVGLNPRYQLNELTYVTEDSQPVLLLARSQIEGRDYTPELVSLAGSTPSIRQTIILDEGTGGIPPGAIGLDAFLTQGMHVPQASLAAAREACGGRDACMIVYTSGSTGRPKGALLHHQGIVEFSLEQNRVWPVVPLRMLNYFPVNHIGCVVDVSTPTLVAGGTIVFLENFSPRRSLELMEQEAVTLWASVPSVFQLQYADEAFPETDLSAVKLIVWEGAPMPADLLDRLLEHGAPLATNYGMTESCGAMTIVPPSRNKEVLSGTVGWPMPGVDVRLANGADVITDIGVTGEIQARSAYNMLGYWNRPGPTAETLSADGWLSTGDLGQRNPDGTYSIVGRSKEMYKSGGYNVYPREVENVIESHPQVDIAAVIGISDPVWQEVGIAYVLVNGDLTAEALEAHCRENLANYKIPKRFFLVRELPLLPIGKVDKVTLRERAATDIGTAAAP